MENQSLVQKPKLEKLGRHYLFALCILAVSFIVCHLVILSFISEQENDSHLINLSGRQRMLSQNISKTALLFGNTSDTTSRRVLLADLTPLLLEWDSVFLALKTSEIKQYLPTSDAQRTRYNFDAIALDHKMISMAANTLYAALSKTITLEYEVLKPKITLIIAHEKTFLKGMDQIVSQYEMEAKGKVLSLKRIGFILISVLLAIILFEIYFIFLPSLKSIRQAVNKLSYSEVKAREMNLEISALYNSLEQAYQDLLEGDLTIFAQCSMEGEFELVSNRFSEVFKMEGKAPGNLFSLLASKGHKADYLKSIKERIQSGNSWTGKISLSDLANDFLMLKINVVSTVNKEGININLLIVSAPESQKVDL